MKKILTLILLLTGLNTMAQAPDFNDLVILFADGDYEKCIHKAEKYMSKDDTRKEPMPYFFMSKCHFEINKDGEFKEKNPEYKRAYSNALKYAATFTRKDRDKVHQKELQVIEYFEELKGAILEDVDAYMHSEKPKYSKCVGELKRLVTFAPEDAGAWLMLATCDYRNMNKTVARDEFKTAFDLLTNLNFKTDVMHMDESEDLNDIENWEKELKVNNTARLLMQGLIESAKMQIEARAPDKAKEIMNIGKQWFEEVEEYMIAYNEIVNG